MIWPFEESGELGLERSRGRGLSCLRMGHVTACVRSGGGGAAERGGCLCDRAPLRRKGCLRYVRELGPTAVRSQGAGSPLRIGVFKTTGQM